MTDHAKALRYIAALVDSPPLAPQICYAAADEIDRLRDANRYLIDISNEAMDDARKYGEAQAEIARLRDMLYAIVNRCEGQAKEIARAALEAPK